MSEHDEQRFEEFQRAQRLAQPVLDRAARAYYQSLNGLWLGNAGAALAALGLIGSVAKDQPELAKALLWPLAAFVFGLIAMGLGAGVSLVQQGSLVRRLEGVDSVLNMRADDIRRPSETAGLSFRDPRTSAGCLAALLFVAGCLLALCTLANSN